MYRCIRLHLRINLSPFTKGCREEGALKRIHQFLESSVSFIGHLDRIHIPYSGLTYFLLLWLLAAGVGIHAQEYDCNVYPFGGYPRLNLVALA